MFCVSFSMRRAYGIFSFCFIKAAFYFAFTIWINWGLEFVRKLGRQAETSRITVLRSGMTGTVGRRWRLKVSDPIYAAFLGATQDTQLRNH